MANEFKHKDPCTTLTQAEYIAACGDGHIFACQATGDIVYASSTTVLSKLAKGAANTVLSMGCSCIPAWTASPSVTDLTIGGGCITLSAATDIDLLDDNASALSFDASGKAGIIDIVTTDCSEGVTMSGTLGVTGVMTATGGIELSHACQNTLTGSGGCLSVEGNVVYRAGGTDVPVADGGTGASTLTDGGVLLGSGTSAVTAMAVLADSEMIVGDGTTDPVAESGATLRTSIGVGTTDSPQFTDLTLTGGCITLTGAATDIDLIDNTASALSFDASGKTGIIDIVTTDCSEGVTMSGTLGVTGVMTATGGIELSHASANTLTASSGVLSIEGNRVFHAGGTDIPVADGGTGASTFTANGILVGNGTSAVAVTAAMATKGHVMIGDGSGVPSMLGVGSNCEVLTACSGEATGVKWAAAGGGGATVREGGQTTEGTTTSTSAADLISATSLTICGSDLATFIAGGRKTAGAAADAGMGLKENCTVIFEGVAGGQLMWRGESSNEAVSGMMHKTFGARVTNYIDGMIIGEHNAYSTGDTIRTMSHGPNCNQTAAHITAQITSLVLRGIVGSASITLGADEMHVYSLAVS